MYIITSVIILLFLNSELLFPYIDPGTGSLLFSAVFGILGSLFFLLKTLIVKLKYFSFKNVMGGGVTTTNDKKSRIIIYGEDKRYYNVFKPIIEELIKLEIPIIYYSSSEDDKIFDIQNEFLHTEYIGDSNKAYLKLNFIEADICLMTTPNLDVFQLKRSKGVKKYIHIVHSPGSIGVYRMYSLDFFDVVLLNGTHQIADIRELEQLRNTKEKELYVVGSTYLDELSNNLKNIKETQSIEEESILIAPSWGPNGLLSRFGKSLIDSVLDLGYNIIIRPHPQSLISEKEVIDNLKDQYKSNNNIEWDHQADSSLSFLRSIAMISDFSGVIFDYSFLTEKPILIPEFEYKKDGFDAYFLKDDMWQLKILPKISTKFNENTISDIKNLINQSLNNEIKSNIKEIKEEAYTHIGQSSKISADVLIKILDNN